MEKLVFHRHPAAADRAPHPPTAGGPPGAWPPAEWMELLRDAAVREDRAVIVVTHDSRVFDFADRIAYMDDGRIVKTEPRRRLAFAG